MPPSFVERAEAAHARYLAWFKKPHPRLLRALAVSSAFTLGGALAIALYCGWLLLSVGHLLSAGRPSDLLLALVLVAWPLGFVGLASFHVLNFRRELARLP